LKTINPMYHHYQVVLPMISFWMATDTYDIVLTNHQYSPEHQAHRGEITAQNPIIARLWRRYLQSAMTLGVIGHIYDLLVLLGYGEEPFVKKNPFFYIWEPDTRDQWPWYLTERLIFKLPVIIKLAHLAYRMCWSEEARTSNRFSFLQRCLIQGWFLIVAPFGRMNEILERSSKLSWQWDYIHTFLHVNVHMMIPWFYDTYFYKSIEKLD